MGQELLGFVRSLDRSIKLVLGIWGCLTAPIMIWTGVFLLIAYVLGIDLQLAKPVILGLELLFIGLFWELAIYFTFIDD